MEIGTWENYGGKGVWWFMGGAGVDITRFYCMYNVPHLSLGLR